MRKSRYTYLNGDTDRQGLEEGVFTDAAKKKIAVVGIGGGCGATFVSSSLAYIMAKFADGVCYVESGKGSMAYRSIPLEAIISRNKAVDYFDAEEAACFYGKRRNLYANVNWAVRLPAAAERRGGIFVAENPAGYAGAAAKPASRQGGGACSGTFGLWEGAAAAGFALRSASDGQFLERIPGRYAVLDNPPIARLREAEIVICVVDPLPSRIREGKEKLLALRENRVRAGGGFSPVLNLPTPVLWVLNKDNSRVSHRELEDIWKIRFDFRLPLLDERIFYHAEYSGVPIFKLLDSALFGRAGEWSGKASPNTAPDSNPLGNRGAAVGSAALRGLRGQPSAPPDERQAVRAELERLAKHILSEIN